MRRMSIDGTFVELPNSPIGINWEYLNMSDPEKRYTPFSSSLTLPFTPTTKRLLGYGDTPAGDMTKIRDIFNVDYWFGLTKAISGGTMKVTSSDKNGYSCNITGRNQYIDDLSNYSIDDIIHESANAFDYGTYSDAVASLVLGFDSVAWKNPGFLLPRVLEDPISGNYVIKNKTTTEHTHELWVSAAAIIYGIEALGLATFKVYEGGSIVDYDSSFLYPFMQKLYSPAWNFCLQQDLPGTNWIIDHKIAGQRTINSKTFDRTSFVTLGGITPWDYIKTLAQLFCASIYQDGSEFTFIPLNEITTAGELNFSGKIKNPVKYPNIPNQEYENIIRYKNTDNLPSDYGILTILAPVNPAIKKDLFSLNLMLPGLYYDATVGDNIFNTDPGANSDLMKTPLILFDDGTLSPACNIIYESSPSDYTVSYLLHLLQVFDYSQFYAGYQLMSAKGICYDVDIAINPYDWFKMRPYRTVRINELGGSFYLNKITNYDPYSGRMARCQVVRHDSISYEIDPSSLSFISTGESKDITITSNVAWKITGIVPPWVTLNKTSGTGDDTLTVTAPNNTGGSRSGDLNITIAGHTTVIALAQDEAFTCTLNHIDTVSSPQYGDDEFVPQPSFEATVTGSGTITIYWACYNSAHVLQNSGSESFAMTAGTNTYTFAHAMTPNVLPGNDYDFRIGKTTSYTLTSNHFNIAS